LRDFIIKQFMGPQIAKNTILKEADSELDTFSEIPKVDNLPLAEKLAVQDLPKVKKPAQTEDKYVYLEHDVLSKEFSFDRETPILQQKPHKIKLCLFSINETLPRPFLEFFFENSNGVYQFPSINLVMEPFLPIIKKEDDTKINMTDIAIIPQNNEQVDQNVENEQGDDEIDIEFFSQCSQFFQKTTGLSHDIASQRYLGFIEKDDVIYVFFNCSKLEGFGKMNIGIIDEILNKKKMYELPIEQHVIDLFLSSPLITHIYYQRGEEIPYPLSVNLCLSDGEGQYKNAYYSDPLKPVSIVNPKVEHPFFGSVYIFSSEPIIHGSTKGLIQGLSETFTETNSTPIKRFALFTDSAKMYKEITSAEQVDKRYICYGFVEKSHELWAVKQVKLFVEL